MSAQDNLAAELNALLSEAMKQPGVADAIGAYAQAREAAASADEVNQSLKAHWVYQSSNSSS